MKNFNRRKLVQGLGGLLAGSLLSSQAISQTASHKHPIVLVHGGWQGSWVWKKLTPLLVTAGHRVYTPTLTGLGDRAHLTHPDLNLDAHIQDVLLFLEMEDLREVLLVGHSYAGFVISAVAERAANRLHSLVYLDAFVPENRKRVTDYLLPLERRQALIKAGQESGYVAPIPLQALGVSDAADLEWATPRLVKQAFATFDQPIRLTAPAGNGFPRSFIASTNPPSGSFGQFAEAIRNNPSWQFFELSTGHQAMISAPLELSRILLRLSS